VNDHNSLGESPIWSVREQKLYWVDSRGPAVFRFDPETQRTEKRLLPSIVGSIGLRSQGAGKLIVALQDGIHCFDFESRVLQLVIDPEADDMDNRFNDGRCDRRGRFWSGTMNDKRRDPTGSLYRFDPDGNATKMRGDIIVPNSICWSPDDRIMYFADTYRMRIMAFGYDANSGTILDEWLFAETSGRPGRPDGSTVDADGFLWNAEYAGGRLVRYAPDGRIDRVIDLPVSQPTSCAFGGPDLSTLYVTSARQRLTEADLTMQPFAGGLLAIDVGIRGLPEPEFAG